MNNLLARWANRPTLQLIVIFILLDAVAIISAELFEAGTLESRFFKIGRDRGMGELFEYAKFALIIYMLLELWRKYGEPVFKAWVILFSVMLADNFIGIHEEVGELIITYIELPDLGFNRPKDLAEILVFAALEGSACLYVAWVYVQSGVTGKQFSHQFCAVFGLFVFCALLLEAMGSVKFEEITETIGMTLVIGWLHYLFRYRYS